MYGYHGLVAGENILGGEFEVDLTVCYQLENVIIKKIDETLDYTQLFGIVKERMKKPAQLLETLATEISSEIIVKFSRVTEVVISIYKLHPPIENFEGAVGVTYRLKR